MEANSAVQHVGSTAIARSVGNIVKAAKTVRLAVIKRRRVLNATIRFLPDDMTFAPYHAASNVNDLSRSHFSEKEKIEIIKRRCAHSECLA